MSQFFRGAQGGASIGNVQGPASSTDNAIARFDGTTGKIIQNSSITIDDNGNLDSTATFSGSTKFILLQNNVNTASSSTRISQLVGGTSAGDVYNEFRIGTARSYSWGIDNNDSQTFKLTTAASGNVDPSSGTTLVDITSAGQISFPAATLTENGLMLVGASGLIESLGEATDGQIPIGSTGLNPVLASITSGTGISVTVGAGSITITNTAGGFTWNEVTGTSVSLAVQNGYVMNNVALVTGTLPGAAALGESIQVIGKGAGLYRIAQNAGQTIHITASSTTTGAGGSLTAIEQFAALELVCTTANTDFTIVDSTGNYTIV